MSKSSIRSKISIRSQSRQKKKKNVNIRGKKEIVFCCGNGDFDPLFKYDQKNPPFKSSITAIESVHECPVLKFRTQFFEDIVKFSKKKGNKAKQKFSKDQIEWNNTGNSESVPGTLQNFIEEDIQEIISKEALKKLIAFKKEWKKNIKISRKKAREKEIKNKIKKYPHWYQDFSISQMSHLMKLKNALFEDFKEKATFRTQNILMKIGIVSKFFKIVPNQIKFLLQKTNVRPTEFLREIYKIISGVDFETEGHKNNYNFNEKLTLSAIAFLSLPEAIIELNERLPSVKFLEIPPKPKPPKVDYPQKMDCPYKETIFIPPNLRLYQIELNAWRKKCEMIPKPKLILPPNEKYSIFASAKEEIFGTNEEQRNKETKKIIKYRVRKESIRCKKKKNVNHFKKSNLKKRKAYQQIMHKKFSVSKEKHSNYLLTELNENDETAENKVSGTKVISNNSNEKLFAKNDSPKKIYPQGRQYLSKNWQLWLQNVDEEFLKVEEEANKLIESVEATMKLVNFGSACDNCCKCKQDKKTDLLHFTSSDHFTSGFTINNEEERVEEEIEELEEEEEKVEIEEKTREDISKTSKDKITEKFISNRNESASPSSKEMQILYEKNFNFTQRQTSSFKNINKPKHPEKQRNFEKILHKFDLKENNNRVDSKENKKIDLKNNQIKNKSRKSKNKTKVNQNLNLSAGVHKSKRKSRSNKLKYEQINKLDIENFKKLQKSKSNIAIVPEKNEISKKDKSFNCKMELDIKPTAPEKTLIYLTDPIRPIESITIKPGGKPCHCREDSSTRKSEEYIPEYELYQSPYGTCVKNKAKIINNEIYPTENKNQLFERKEFSSNKLNDALKDQCLIDFYTQDENSNSSSCMKNSKFTNKNYHKKKIRNLKVKKPVCECKYERKIVMKNEENEKWLNRQKRLKSYKKVPITHIAGILRPMEMDRKFIISGVRNISKENGNDEIQYCISGVAENYKMGSLQYLVNGVCMHTPIVTPKQSKTSISHISNSNNENRPETLPENFIKNINKKHRQKMGTKKYKKIANNEKFKNLEKYKKSNSKEYSKKLDDFANVSKKYKIQQERNKIENKGKNENEIKKRQDVINNSKTVNHLITNNDGETILDLHQKRNEIQLNVFDTHQNLLSNTEIKTVKKHIDNELDTKQLVTNELKKMAYEGFIFAKLPRCFDFPQLNYWIMYRKGVFFSDQDKEKLLKQSVQAWTKLKLFNSLLKPMSINLNKKEKSELNFENILSLKRKIAELKELFYKQIREDRVKRSANLWNSMEFGKFPCLWFKKTFFTYLPDKEINGHILEPYQIF